MAHVPVLSAHLNGVVHVEGKLGNNDATTLAVMLIWSVD
jgi:hypothetical protein